jgi:glutathione S-transferase
MDHISRNVVPAFYRYLQAQDQNAQTEFGKEFVVSLDGLVALFERAEREIVDAGGAAGEGEVKALKQGLGLWVEGGDLSMADVMVGPCSLAFFLLLSVP